MGRPRKIVALPMVETPPSELPAQSLGDFIAEAEARYAKRDVFAVEITHPEVTEQRVHPGRYSGIRLVQGVPSVRYSDGTTE